LSITKPIADWICETDGFRCVQPILQVLRPPVSGVSHYVHDEAQAERGKRRFYLPHSQSIMQVEDPSAARGANYQSAVRRVMH